jgi:hypothetical protein
MCLPVAALPALAIASGVLQGAGQLAGGIQVNNQSKYDSKVAKQNAALEVESAHTSYEAGKDERRDFWRKVGQTRGEQIASMAANGIDIGYGTAARIQDDTEMMAGEDAKNLYRNIEERTRGHYINSSNYLQEAKAARARGKAALIGSVIQAGSSILGGVSQAGGLKAKMGAG